MKTLIDAYNEYTLGNRIIKREYKPKHLFTTLAYLVANNEKEVVASRKDEILSLIRASIYPIDLSKPFCLCGVIIHVSPNSTQ